MTILDTIMQTKRAEIQTEQSLLSWRELERQAEEAPTRSMRDAFLPRGKAVQPILAEISEASPSKGHLAESVRCMRPCASL